jgi:hypothetical protein
MILKIKRQEKTEFIECDRIEYSEVKATDLTENQIKATYWKGDKVTEVAFKFAYLMEHGKTVDTIGLTAEQS